MTEKAYMVVQDDFGSHLFCVSNKHPMLEHYPEVRPERKGYYIVSYLGADIDDIPSEGLFMYAVNWVEKQYYTHMNTEDYMAFVKAVAEKLNVAKRLREKKRNRLCL